MLFGIIPNPYTERRRGNGKPKEKYPNEVLRYGRRKAADRREDEAASIKQYGAYLRKMAIDGYILVIDRSDTKAYIRELQAVSRNINQIAKRANATGAVYQQDIEDIKKAVDEIWRLQRRTLLNQP
ncbi:MobC family plasmid mobilization relaxosome protein [Collinsella aerofaciens]|uniref:MobC family plasmid mobilization relaxosome protein n=1 Tax=Collinsella aerofaciens TaxID=74426 RepID=UPI003F66CB04